MDRNAKETAKHRTRGLAQREALQCETLQYNSGEGRGEFKGKPTA